MFKLVIQDDEGKTTVVPLIRDEITIGRKEGNTIRLTERNVSRRHARILRSNNEVQIEDLGSYNGIRVNNARIAERVSLRISDQVQIGDYKLYLKAEGVEQVDDARTMPIERIDNSGSPTEAMPALQQPVSATAATPTQPIPATPAPTARELGVKDTDPAARPVATQAQINALTATAGYGKMVVLSSNFAGKEFELTRPQMIVGRTDENDLVINHRSISRNHAKITRDPETQRYTISDLQSSNGVRVNGQDYGKVELRRGDVVDLGHVRLRFVEPGEDFVFSRDAQIADIETGGGGKKGLVVAAVLAIVVVGAIGAFFAMKGGGGGKDGSNGGSPGSDQLANKGSDGSGSNAVVVPDLTPDAAVAVADDCVTRAVSEKRWDNLNDCTDADPAKQKAIHDQAHFEQKNKGQFETLAGDLKNNAWSQAKKDLDGVPANSVYRKDAEDLWNTAADKNKDKWKGRVADAKGDCKTIDQLVVQADKEGSEFGDAIRGSKCPKDVANNTTNNQVRPLPPVEDCKDSIKNDTKGCKKQFCDAHPENGKCQPAAVQAACDPQPNIDAGTQAEGRGDHMGALTAYESALKCKPGDAHTTQLAFMAACNGANVPGARKHWKHLSPDAKNRLITMCLRAHIDQSVLDQ